MRRRPSLIDIAEELQVAIFLKLEVKSILTCKCVCKHFRYIIEHPYFVITHLKNQSDHSQSPQVLTHYGGGIYADPFYQIDHYLLTFDDNSKDIRSCLPLRPPIPIIEGLFRSYVVGSCNGLICVAVWFDNYSGAWNKKSSNRVANTADFLLLLWNPVIRQCRYLPKHHSSCRPDVLEFGYLRETDDYVVVKVGSPGFHLEVYKMSTDSWKTIDFNWLDRANFIPTVHRDQSPVFVNGSFHWAVKNSTFNCIVYFNLKDEELGLIKVLNNDSAILDVVVDIDIRDEMQWELSAIDEKLAMIYWNRERCYVFEIWVMNEYGIENSWTRLFQIVEDLNMYLNPISYWTNGLVLLDWTTYSKSNSVQEYGYFFYDIESRSFKKIPLEITRWEVNGLTNFVETLVPVRKVELKKKGCHVPANIDSKRPWLT